LIKIIDNWIDYQVLGTGDGRKLERWGQVYLLRPDPQVIWHEQFALSEYAGLHAEYKRDSTGGGKWVHLRKAPQEWTITCPIRDTADKAITLLCKPMGFKHTGVFPEQAANWQVMYDIIAKAVATSTVKPNVLNLFGYTGAASVACAMAGADVCHVDAAKSMVDRCRQNAELNKVGSIRYIVDDCAKFVQRQIKRGVKYDAIIMDPPSYGRGPGGELWKLEDNIVSFVQLCVQLLSSKPLFLLINSYTTGLQPSVLSNILNITLPKGKVQAYELVLPTCESGIVLPCGCSGFWTL
jgi:23S rRNA (cytosine1962-C5)-methyltransferase